MAVEVAESNLTVVMQNGTEADGSSEVVKTNIKFGSHGVDEPPKEVNKVADSSVPKDAVDEWPEPTQIHSVYIARVRVLEDQNLTAKLEVAEKELQKKNQGRTHIIEKLKAKRAERSQLIDQFRALNAENKQFKNAMDEKRKEMEPLQKALGKLRGSSGGRDRGSGVCSSEEELNDIIKSLQYRIQHESIPLSEEKQILREIKQLEGTRSSVITNAAERAKIQDSIGEKEDIQDQVKLLGVDLDGVRKEKQVIAGKLKLLDEEKTIIDKEIGALEEELTAVTEKRDKIFDSIKEMRKQREEGNHSYYENRAILNKAKALAAKKEVEALKELSHSEIEKFMSQWNSSKAFRDDYERRILPSLDMRQLSKDGRMRNPGEKPINQVEAPPSSEPETVKKSVKTPEVKDSSVPNQDNASSEPKIEKPNSVKPQKENKKIEEDEEVIFTLSRPLLPKKEEVDEKKLKELKREEELAKRRQTEERKKKLAERAAVKAASRALKDAEKKIKEREKKAEKKSGTQTTMLDSEESTEVVQELSEPEKVEEKIEESVIPENNKASKENFVRRKTRARGGPDSLPKAILKRKRGTNYWAWAVPASVMVVLVLMVVGYGYLS